MDGLKRDEAGGPEMDWGPGERRKPKAGDDGPGRRAVMFLVENKYILGLVFSRPRGRPLYRCRTWLSLGLRPEGMAEGISLVLSAAGRPDLPAAQEAEDGGEGACSHQVLRGPVQHPQGWAGASLRAERLVPALS